MLKIPIQYANYTEHQCKVTNDLRTLNKGALQLSFLWCTVPCIGTTENGIRHEWNHGIHLLTNASCFHWFLWEIAKLQCFLKIGASPSPFDGIIETISMVFSWNIFQTYNCMFIFENYVFKFWKATKNTKCMWSSCSIVTGLPEQIYCYRRVCSIPDKWKITVRISVIISKIPKFRKWQLFINAEYIKIKVVQQLVCNSVFTKKEFKRPKLLCRTLYAVSFVLSVVIVITFIMMICLQYHSSERYDMSLVTRKPVFRVSDEVRLKPACAATEAS